MRSQLSGLLMMGCLGLVLAAGAEAGDLEDIQGAWRLTSAEQGGRSAGGGELKGADFLVSFLGDKIVAGSAKEAPGTPIQRLFGPASRREGTFRLDPSKRPKTTDIAYKVMKQDKWVRSTELGIYLLEGDTLKILTASPGQARPTGFPQEVASGTLLVLKRQKTPDGPGEAGAVTDPTRVPKGANPAPDPIVGKWSWFTGGTVTVRADGTLTHDLGNDGTWTRQDPARRLYALRWRLGGFVDTVTLSEDGQGLSGTNQARVGITARRIRDGAEASPGTP